jgi:hypothetical protein
MQQVKSVRTILVRAIECAWAKSKREKESRGRKSNARATERGAAAAAAALEKALIQMSDRLFLVCERERERAQH